MLVLSRHENEAIVIDGRIKITVVRISDDKIRLASRPQRKLPFGERNLSPRSPRGNWPWPERRRKSPIRPAGGTNQIGWAFRRPSNLPSGRPQIALFPRRESSYDRGPSFHHGDQRRCPP